MGGGGWLWNSAASANVHARAEEELRERFPFQDSVASCSVSSIDWLPVFPTCRCCCFLPLVLLLLAPVFSCESLSATSALWPALRLLLLLPMHV